MGWTCRSISSTAAASPRAFAASAASASARRACHASQARAGSSGAVSSSDSQRLGDGGPDGGQPRLPRREFGDGGQQREAVRRVAAARRVDLAREAEAIRCGVEPALIGVHAGAVEMQPDRGTTDRIQLETLIGGRRGLVPAAEIEQGLGDMTQEDAAVRAGHAKALRDRESFAGGLQRRLGAPDPIEQGGEVGVPQRDPLDTTELLGDRQPSAVGGDPTVHVSGHRLRPAEDAQGEGLLGPRQVASRHPDGLAGHRGGAARVAAEQPQARDLGEDPGPCRRRGLAPA